MTFGVPTVIRPGATALVGVMGPVGKDGLSIQGDPGVPGPAVFTPITAWVSGMTYAAGSSTSPASFVSYQGGSYACTTTHTSGVFAIDLAAGLWEPVGSKGDKGDPGKPGSTWYPGSAAPSAAVGIDGDYFFRTDTGDVLLKVTGAWTVIGNIKGAAGNTLQNGPGPPSNGLGANGDFYIDTANTRIYGPKAAGAWPSSSTSLVGSGAGNVNPFGTFAPGDLVVAQTNDGKVIQSAGGPPGTAAFKNVGTSTGNVAAADDGRIVGALQTQRALAEIAALGPLAQALVRQNIGTLSRGRATALAILN